MCVSCGGSQTYKPIKKSSYDVAVEVATVLAQAENKMHVVLLLDDGRYVADCLDCRNKTIETDGTAEGTIIAYIR